MGLHQSESTLSGLVAPFLLPSPPSRLCGSPRPSTTRQDHPLSTESASNLLGCCLCLGLLFAFAFTHTTESYIVDKIFTYLSNKLKKKKKKKKKKVPALIPLL